ncbi:unnamed protein product [Haemonchus placei]|uniref:Glycosyltransferase family 92 protein n=1 Tax=Haemonchus placei TaxID=6290 RepID=A0A158QL65_HAEPC|nr:unnamed protein product [Haemonchus placei]
MESDVIEPSLLSFFPHLSPKDMSSLRPLLFTKATGRERKIAFCMLVVKREKPYILQSLHSLLTNLEKQWRRKVVFIVMFAYIKTRTKSFMHLMDQILKTFAAEIQMGLVEVVAIPPKWYDFDMGSIQSTFKDSPERIIWRTKQNLVPGRLEECRGYLAKKHFVFIVMRKSKLSFFPKSRCTTWQRRRYVRLIYDAARNLHRIMVSPPVFQHIDSLPHSTPQNLKDEITNNYIYHKNPVNPPAILRTSMIQVLQHTAQAAYNSHEYMWFTEIGAGDYLTVDFAVPARIVGILIISGVDPAPLGRFGPETVVSVRYHDGNRRNLGNFTVDGDFLAHLDGLEVSSLELLVTAQIGHPVSGNLIEKEIAGNRLLSSVFLQHTAFCIPVVLRKEAYIFRTLHSLLSLSNLEEEFRHDVVFIVMFAFIDTAVDSFNSMIEDILGEFANEIQTGLLEVAAIPPKWYDLEFDAIQPTFNDSPERMQWRTKQNLDYIYLMNYGSRRADYYMQLEDDIKATSRYGRIIFDYIKFKQDRPWFIMQFSTLGAIGRLYRSEDVKYLTYAIALYYRYKPVDWILYSVENSRYCSSYGELTHCKQDRDLCSVTVAPPLFQHIGRVSSLSGKAQKLRERIEKASTQKCDKLQSKRGNPSARITSTMHHYRECTAQAGYDKEGYMWFIDVKQNDSLIVDFEKPARITSEMFAVD